jgi:hypothetical protein
VFRRDDESELSAAGEGVTAPDSVLELQTVGRAHLPLADERAKQVAVAGVP